MRKFILGLAMAVLLSAPGMARAFDWNSSPNNWKNSPSNWENSPNRFGNDRVIRDNRGNVRGYAVPKSDGGVNIFDTQGNRKGYTPGPRW